MTNSFSFDHVIVRPEEQIGAHSASTWEISVVITGGGTRTIGDVEDPIRMGDVVLIPPGIMHHWRFDNVTTDSDGRIENISLTFTTRLLNSLKDTFPEIADRIENLLALTDAIQFSKQSNQNILRLLGRMDNATTIERIPVLVELIMLLSVFSDTQVVYRNNMLTAAERKMDRLRIYCKCNYEKSITLSDAASHLGMNKSSFCKFVRRRTCTTFSHYLNAVRLEHSLHLLAHTDMHVSEIAYCCGFSNVAYFNKLFKAKHGITPSQLRNGGMLKGTRVADKELICP